MHFYLRLGIPAVAVQAIRRRLTSKGGAGQALTLQEFLRHICLGRHSTLSASAVQGSEAYLRVFEGWIAESYGAQLAPEEIKTGARISGASNALVVYPVLVLLRRDHVGYRLMYVKRYGIDDDNSCQSIFWMLVASIAPLRLRVVIRYDVPMEAKSACHPSASHELKCLAELDIILLLSASRFLVFLARPKSEFRGTECTDRCRTRRSTFLN